MSKLDQILLLIGTTGVRQFWFTRAEAKEALKLALDITYTDNGINDYD